jgi:trehalose 6-phosphate synthase
MQTPVQDKSATKAEIGHRRHGPDAQETKYDFMVVSNRLPVDRCRARRARRRRLRLAALPRRAGDGACTHDDQDRRRLGGLARRPRRDRGTVQPRRHGPGARPAQRDDVELYYEGFSNATLWPLYHDVIAPPEFHRTWWDAYRTVNRRFADAVVRHADDGATVWVQDYQLQLVPRMLREARPDLKIGFFNHIPFPPPEIFAQLPWRQAIIDGLLGADLVGFQRSSDAGNFMRSARRFLGASVKQQQVHVKGTDGEITHIARAQAFPISIDVQQISELAAKPEIIERARQIRQDLGNPKTILLGVDRLDYTKGIRHRLKAYEELLADGKLSVSDATLIQVASPSRERVEQYRLLREEVEGTVGHINGTYDTMENTAVRYLHHSYPVEEMVALYLAADVMLVTALRDGMNLVAKEYVTARTNNDGALVLSEFAGAADQLKQALLMNPHDIDGLKNAIMRAVEMSPRDASRRMRAMRKQILDHDVDHWSADFLKALKEKVVRDDS